MSRIFIIAEAGVNHNGDLATAKRMVEVAAEAKADAVKFQTFRAERFVSASALKAVYQLGATDSGESQLDMIRNLELDHKMHRELIEHCRRNDIIFLSTPFDCDSIDMLCELGLDILKIPSGEITNLPYLRKIGSLGKELILSTGMSNMEEVEAAVSVLVEAGTNKDDITVLHCNTEYPTPAEDANIRAMLSIREHLGVRVGYSDHTMGIEAAIAAAALGAGVIEKHFTLDRDMAGPDHRASLEPGELKDMVDAIRNVEKMLGDGVKKASASEQKNIAVVRKSIVAACDIKKGQMFAEDNITTKRPGSGMSPMQWDRVIGKVSDKNYAKDELIESVSGAPVNCVVCARRCGVIGFRDDQWEMSGKDEAIDL